MRKALEQSQSELKIKYGTQFQLRTQADTCSRYDISCQAAMATCKPHIWFQAIFLHKFSIISSVCGETLLKFVFPMSYLFIQLTVTS